MTLIKSISGIRGTIGGTPNENLTPLDVVKFASAYGKWLIEQGNGGKVKVVMGRDARISGEMVAQLVSASLSGLGIDVIDLGLSTTPTVEMAVPSMNASGGVIITASHNPAEWNALKLLNKKGEFISSEEGQTILKFADEEDFSYAKVHDLGKIEKDEDFIHHHIEAIKNLPLVETDAIRQSGLKIVVDAVNSTGGLFIPALLKTLGVREVIEIYCEPTGHFPHNPEPLPEHLTDLCAKIKETGADLGITVDPDVDRLAFVCEDGTVFGEEYTLVAVADYVLQNRPGDTVSNLSSTQALKDVTENHGGTYHASAVGEVNVVEKMKEVNAVIGGEGNGGIIYPELHYGRDALVGIALFLSHLALSGTTVRELRDSYPHYVISKNKIQLTPDTDVDKVLDKVKAHFSSEEINTVDGVKIIFSSKKEWVHLRKSNTEPIIRVYAESSSKEKADSLANEMIQIVSSL